MKFDENADFLGFYSERDKFYWAEVENLIENYDIPLETILKNGS
jgi:hypothetical protein